MMRLGVLVSGNGTNLGAVLAAIAEGKLNARVVWVGSDRPGCPALARAAASGVPWAARRPADFPDRATYEAALVADLKAYGEVDLVVLAGYLRIAGPVLRTAFPRMINLHPSLLPELPGLGSIRRALCAGLSRTGCTVHVVDAGVDTGPVLAQRTVPIYAEDTAETLEARMHAAEHALLVETLARLASGQLAWPPVDHATAQGARVAPP